MTKIKGITAWGYSVLGTDDSFIDGLAWYPDEFKKRWENHEDVKIVKIKIVVLRKIKEQE